MVTIARPRVRGWGLAPGSLTPRTTNDLSTAALHPGYRTEDALIATGGLDCRVGGIFPRADAERRRAAGALTRCLWERGARDAH